MPLFSHNLHFHTTSLKWGNWASGRSGATPDSLLLLLWLWCCQLRRAFAQRFSFQGQFIGIVDEAIEEGIGQGRRTDVFILPPSSIV